MDNDSLATAFTNWQADQWDEWEAGPLQTAAPGPLTVRVIRKTSDQGGYSCREITNNQLALWVAKVQVFNEEPPIGPIDEQNKVLAIKCQGNGLGYAQLFAAAPDLLEACRIALGYLDNNPVAMTEDVRRTLKAAIAKAEGKEVEA